MAIVKPEQMNFSEDNINLIVAGLPGVGKTTLACSAPNPLIIDVDNGMKRVKYEHRQDSMFVKTYEQLLDDLKDAKGYKTIVCDTTGALVDLLKDWAMRNYPSACKKGGGVSQQGYGVVKSEYLRLSSELRKTHNVVNIFHSTKKADKDGNLIYDIMCEGAARELVWQPADLGGFVQIIDGKRYIGFTPQAEYSAKSSYGIKGMIEIPELNSGEPNDFLTRLFTQVKANIAEESKAMSAKTDVYKNAIDCGDAIISQISTADQVLPALEAIRGIDHALTSKKELESKLKNKIKELNITYNAQLKCYEQK